MANCHNVTFVCEHWLLPKDIAVVKNIFKGTGKMSFFKSSVDPLVPLSGRPYGGIGFICDPRDGYSYKFEECDSDRLCGLHVFKNKELVLIIYGIYLPFDDHTTDTMESYMDILDKLQCLIDSSAAKAPVIITGDMNTCLPQVKTMARNWFHQRPFSRRSGILDEFLCENELCVGNFAFKQDINYTYRRNSLRSYIDHLFLPKYLLDNLVKCSILYDCEDNLSDHFALTACYRFSSLNKAEKCNYNAKPTFPHARWDIPEFQSQYVAAATRNIGALKVIHPDSVTHLNAKDTINNLCNSLCETLHQCVKECSPPCSESKTHKSKSWWNKDCVVARRRNQLFYYIWKESGRPLNGHIHDCYKASKKGYRKACRDAVRHRARLSWDTVDKLYQARRPSQMWNIIKQARSSPQVSEGINLDDLSKHYSNKFSASMSATPTIDEAERDVCNKFNQLKDSSVFSDFVLSEHRIKNCIKRLKNRSSPGLDGISAEHLKFAFDSNLPLHLSVLFTLCLRFGIVPDSFSTGILVPVLKKTNLDPTVANNYRPITVSVVLSKILELYIIDECEGYQFSDYQFGFIPKRNSYIATSLAHDVSELCVAQGSSVFLCSLDVEAAFDGIPFSVLFNCANKILPDICWRLLYGCYKKLYVHVRWKNQLGPAIAVQRGTRQGGLSSPLLFNVFYQELVDKLSKVKSGITIGARTYNVFAYADDLLLASTTVSGLQELINISVSHISERGLRFNPQKTVCVRYGKNTFVTSPSRNMEGVPLEIKEEVKYLGTILGQPGGKAHVESRVSAANKAYYSLQGSGLCKDGVSPYTGGHVYSTAIRTVLLYGCSSVFVTKPNLKKLDKAQGKYLKSMLGLSYSCHTTPLLQALCIPSCSTAVLLSSMDLIKSCLSSSSVASTFYRHLLKIDVTKSRRTLIARSHQCCVVRNIKFSRYLLNDSYANQSKWTHDYNVRSGVDGLVDSIRTLLANYNANSVLLLKNLLRSF